jgi:N-carbamoyl-L-amino-acid hydrolase
MPKTNLPVAADRIWADVMALADITDPARPYATLVHGVVLEGRAWLAQRFADAGLSTHIDAAGNLIGAAGAAVIYQAVRELDQTLT